jgi:DNA repair protein RecN (Recombination protein N)
MALREITIRNFALIRQLEIEISDGLTVITGETGAGKSIVLGALNLLLGSRAEANMIRHGEDQCEISALFDITELQNVREWLAHRDLAEELPASISETQSYCLVRRVLRNDKPTKCYINDQPTTLASLKELGAMLVDLHGQHEHQSLLRKSTQRQIIDEFAKHPQKLKKMTKLAATIRRLSGELESITSSNSDTADRMELLSFQINELSEAEITSGEFESLIKNQKRLAHTEALQQGVRQSLDELFHNEDHNVSTDLGKQINTLNELCEFDSRLNPALESLNSALSQIDDAQADLERSLAQVEADPERLQEIDQRLATLVNLARKHRCDEDQLSARLATLEEEYTRLETLQQAPEKLQAELDELMSEYHQIASQVSERRQVVATTLSKEISAQMQSLGMRGGCMEIQVEPQIADDIVVSEHGIDQIDYLVSANYGMPLQPMQKTASGGELSRISLAIQVITSEQSQTPSLVFDEVDVGVGGKVAGIVGERLQQLGKHAQVICITHLPQVAAQGDHHLAVDKVSSSYETYSTLITLDHEQRVEEIARMLGGKEITEQTRVHAAEMLSISAADSKNAIAS